MWRTSNHARLLPQCNVLIVHLIGQKAFYTVHVEISWVIQNSRVSWIEIDSMLCRFRITWLVRDALTELDMENLRSRSTITRPSTRGNDAVDKLAQEDHSYTLIRSEFLRYSSNWSTGPNKPMATRPDYRTAVALNIYLYRKSEEYQKTIPPQDQDLVRENSKFSDSYRRSSRQENWVEILDTFFKLVADWSMGLERILIESQVKATELRFDLIFLSLLQGFVYSRWNPL